MIYDVYIEFTKSSYFYHIIYDDINNYYYITILLVVKLYSIYENSYNITYINPLYTSNG